MVYPGHLTPVGKWTTDFMERVFDDDRKNEALLSFYNDYINKVLFSGSYFKSYRYFCRRQI